MLVYFKLIILCDNFKIKKFCKKNCFVLNHKFYCVFFNKFLQPCNRKKLKYLLKINFKNIFKIYFVLFLPFFKTFRFIFLMYTLNYNVSLNSLFKKKVFKNLNKNSNYFYTNKKKIVRNANIYNFIYRVIYIYFEQYFKKNLFFLLKKSNFILNKFKKNNLFLFIERKLFKNLKIFKNKLILKEMVEIIWLSFLLKDSHFFLNWFSIKFQQISIKNHKPFLRILNLLMVRYYNFFLRIVMLLVFFLI